MARSSRPRTTACSTRRKEPRLFSKNGAITTRTRSGRGGGILYNKTAATNFLNPWSRYSMSNIPSRSRSTEATARIAIAPLDDVSTFKNRAYAALRDVIVSLDVYDGPGEVRLDERRLAQDLGVSRTPVREAMAQLEREGFVRSVPRRGVYVVPKSKKEGIERITSWGARESMAARLITQIASDEEIAMLRKMFTKFENGTLHAKLDEYSEVNIEFHQSIIRMSRNGVLISLAENLFTHM